MEHVIRLRQEVELLSKESAELEAKSFNPEELAQLTDEVGEVRFAPQ